MDPFPTRPPFFTHAPYRTFRALQRATYDLEDTKFPKDETFIEYEGSTITIPMRVIEFTKINGVFVETSRLEETLHLKAFMRLEVYPAYMNQQGTREFQFIIRDWELYEQSRILNKYCKGSFNGYLKDLKDGRLERQTVGITFSLSKTYIKYNDPDDQDLAAVEDQPTEWPKLAPLLSIENMANAWNQHNNIYWEIEAAKDGNFHVNFYRLPFSELLKLPKIERNAYLVASTKDPLNDDKPGIAPGADFVANGRPDPDYPPNPKRPAPLVIAWKLGRKPTAEHQGILHEVAPAQSFCVADQGPAAGQPADSSDFPARITYCASYNVFLNSHPIVVNQAGIAMARNVQQIPPRDVLVAFEKPFSGEIPIPEDNDERTPDRKIRVEFGSGTCTGMIEISADEWRAGKQLALAAQTSIQALRAFGVREEDVRRTELFIDNK